MSSGSTQGTPCGPEAFARILASYFSRVGAGSSGSACRQLIGLLVNGVFTDDGQALFTVIPCLPTSSASAFVRPMTPHLEAQ